MSTERQRHSSFLDAPPLKARRLPRRVLALGARGRLRVDHGAVRRGQSPGQFGTLTSIVRTRAAAERRARVATNVIIEWSGWTSDSH